MPEIILTEPHFTIDPRAEQYVDNEHGISVGEGVLCLQALQRGISTSPGAYLYALSGEATSAGQDAEARMKVAAVLNARLDRFIEYDLESDEAITGHPDYIAALAESQAAHSYEVSKNGLGTAHMRRTHPEAGSRLNTVRITMLRLYAQRVIDWQLQQAQMNKAS